MGTKAERRAARERVSAYHQAQLAGLLGHVAAAIDRYRAGEIGARDADEAIHHYHRAAGELWKFCFSRSGGSHDEFIAGILDQMAAGGEPVDWWQRAEPRRQLSTTHTASAMPRGVEVVTGSGHASPRSTAPSRPIGPMGMTAGRCRTG